MASENETDKTGVAASSCATVNAADSKVSALLASVHRAYLLPLLAKHERNAPLFHEDLRSSHSAGKKVLMAAIVGGGSGGGEEQKAAEQSLEYLHNSQIQAYEAAARSALTRRASAITAALACDIVPTPYRAHANELEGHFAERCAEVAKKDPRVAGWRVDDKVLEECVARHVREAARRRWKEDLKKEKEAEEAAAKVGAHGNKPSSFPPSDGKEVTETEGGQSNTPVEEVDDEAHADDEDDGEDDEEEDEDATDHDVATEDDDDEDAGAGDNSNGDDKDDADDEVIFEGTAQAVAAPKRPRMVRLGGPKKAGATAARKRKLGGGGADGAKVVGGNEGAGEAASSGNKRRRNAAGGGRGRSRSGRGRGRRPRGGAGRGGA